MGCKHLLWKLKCLSGEWNWRCFNSEVIREGSTAVSAHGPTLSTSALFTNMFVEGNLICFPIRKINPIKKAKWEVSRCELRGGVLLCRTWVLYFLFLFIFFIVRFEWQFSFIMTVLIPQCHGHKLAMRNFALYFYSLQIFPCIIR